MCHGLQLAQEEKHHCIFMNKIKYSKLFKSIRRGYWRNVLFLQIDNARYHWSIETLEFYYENN